MTTTATTSPATGDAIRTLAAGQLRWNLNHLVNTFNQVPEDKLDFKPSETANSPRELIQSECPRPAGFLEPSLDLVQCLRLHPASPLPADLNRDGQAGLFQDPQVLESGGERNVQGSGEVGCDRLAEVATVAQQQATVDDTRQAMSEQARIRLLCRQVALLPEVDH